MSYVSDALPGLTPPGGARLPSDERAARAVLMRIAEPGDPRLGEALQRLGAVALVAQIAAGARAVPGARAMRVRLAATDGAAELALGRAAGARLICPGEPDWPTQLDDLGPTRPIGLWFIAGVPLRPALLRSVSVVGSRAASSYGLHVASELAAGLADGGWCVVSGAALGIDAAAHRGALAAGGRTVAVLAGGVDVPYPAGHRTLLERIAAEGVVLSEAPCGAAPARRRFLTRNRMIAALTRGTVVVEAALRSGAATTARWAGELGRAVLAVPGPVTSTASLGSNEMLRAGTAVAVTRAEEVIEDVGRIGADLAPPRERPGSGHPRDNLPHRLVEVLEALPARRPTGAAELGRECGISPSEASASLGELAALGMVERVDGGWRPTPLGRGRG